MEVDNCPFCKKTLRNTGQLSTLTNKGVEGILKAATERNVTISVIVGQRIHMKCRAQFINPKCIQSYNKKSDENPGTSGMRLRSQEGSNPFSYRTHCFICGELITDRDKKLKKVYNVRSDELNDSILKACDCRKDEWADIVRARVLHVISDLHAADAVYHQTCSILFRSGKKNPVKTSGESEGRTGRPPDEVRLNAFLKVADFLCENDDEQTTVKDLVKKMQEYLTDESLEPYSTTFMKKKLLEHFNDEIFIATVNGRSDVVTFRSTASHILQDVYKTKNDTIEQQKIAVLLAAAKIIRSDIKEMETRTDIYPSPSEIANTELQLNILPKSLQLFLRHLLTGVNIDRKVASLGQALMQGARPRVAMLPLQFGLGVQMHHNFSSKFLVNTLHKLGFCCSYNDVVTFERSAAATSGTDIPGVTDDHFIQYSADNVDHNIRTLDGFGTFHGMGILASVTPGTVSHDAIRKKVKVSLDDLRKIGAINIKFYHNPSNKSNNSLKYSRLPSIELDRPSNVDILWNISLLLNPSRPSWNGMMQFIHNGNHPGKSSFEFLPMIDMDPSNESCIFSTLLFVSQHAEKHSATPVLTFDQPLWWKAMVILSNEPSDSPLKKIVLRLGGLHTQMSFLGSIGHLMENSGLHEALKVIYAENTIKHIMSGHAIARAIRGHLIIYAALSTILAERSVKKDENEDDIQEASGILEGLLSLETSLEEAEASTSVARLNEAMVSYMETLKGSRTATLWLQYMHMIDILRQFIKAERLGNWEMHLNSMQQMLPFFAASGHNLYAKSTHMYLQTMLALKETAPHIVTKFMEGFHVARRSDRLWGGLSTDLIIEQVLMRSVKTTGGLTRGRGMTEMQRLVWLLGRPECSSINNAMQEYCDTVYATSEQHVDLSISRKKRDEDDTRKVQQFFLEHNPFDDHDNSLRNIATGVVANQSVNVDKSEDIGNAIMEDMVDKLVSEYSFKKAKQAVTLSTRKKLKVDNEVVEIDSTALFQRLLLTAKSRDEDLLSLFSYELCHHPASLFDEAGLMREATKHVLSNSIWKLIGSPSTFPENALNDVQYVLDGGSLLHKLNWERGSTFNDLFQKYVVYVTKRYGEAIVVFDGYQTGPSTKDQTHKRRNAGNTGVPVHFTPSMNLTVSKEQLLSSKENKQRFINYLSENLENAGCTTYHASSDADLLIVQKAIDSASNKRTVVIGEDTDLLVLLLYHAKNDSHDLYLYPEPKGNAKTCKVYDIKNAKNTLTDNVCKNILFGHAVLGCDTTSRIFSIGKGVVLKLLLKNSFFNEQASVFLNPNSSQHDVETAGKQAIATIFGFPDLSLNEIRLRLFSKKLANSTSHVKPEMLPPTEDAAKFHSYRTYHQVQQWLGNALPPSEWGWLMKDILVPIKMSIAPAPENLLKLIKCGCKGGCLSSSKCSCKESNVPCSDACTNCRGVSCSNNENPYDSTSSSDEES